ncbi:MAG: GNAT family N-acetyltransferase, partial [Lachnospiraceae bacterium]|nr:GNAT family N-acetyltransferase [Lachnospiraceae bacterium]
ASGILVAVRVNHWEIIWIYVAEECRRKGVASALLHGFSEYYFNGRNGRARAYVTEAMDYRRLIPLLQKAGYSIGEMDGGAYFETELESINDGILAKGKRKCAVPIRSLAKEELKTLGKHISLRKSGREIPLPVAAEDYEPCSHIGLDKEGVIGACLVRKNARGLQISLLYAEKGRKNALFEILSAALAGMKGEYPGWMRVGTLATDAIGSQICRKLAQEPDEYRAYKAELGK